MKERENSLIATISCSLIAVALCCQLPLSARADDAGGGFKLETASLDVAQSSNQATSISAGEITLHGGVRKHQDSLEATAAPSALQNPPLEATAVDNAVKLQSQEAAADAYKLAAQKLSSGMKLSADEYRALGVGCTGFEADRTFFQKIAKVTLVYRGSPADEAGIRTGDRLIDNEKDNEQARANPSIPQWQVTLGQAGSTMDITVLRHGKPITLTLVRMNIEDIQEAKYRHEWEQMVRELGNPQQGTFTGTSIHNLAADSQ